MSHTRSGAVGRVRGREDSMGVGRISRSDPGPNDLLPSAGTGLAGKRSDAEANYPPAVYTITDS